MQSRKDFKNVNKTNGLFFFETYCLITVTVCANIFSKRANARYLISTHTHCRNYKTTSFKKNPLLKCQ